MGKVYKTGITSSIDKNTVSEFQKNSFKKNDIVVKTKLPIGNKIVLSCDKTGVWKNSTNFKNYNKDNSGVSKYLETNIYKAVDVIRTSFGKTVPLDLYGYLSRDGITFSEIRLNTRWVDYKLTKELFNLAKVNFTEPDFVGMYKDIKQKNLKGKSFILRKSVLLAGGKRSIFARNVNK